MGVIVCLSGGVDSAVLLGRAVEAGDPAEAVWFGYRQPAAAQEWAAAAAIAARCGARLHDVILPIAPCEMARGPGVEGPRIVPGRNLVFLAVAAALAEERGFGEVWFGAIADDASAYADCRPAFVEGVNAVAGVKIAAPLLGLSKRDVVAEARARGLLALTWSCYAPRGAEPCGGCDSCRSRDGAT